MHDDEAVNDIASRLRTWANEMPREDFLARVSGHYLLITIPARNDDHLAFNTRAASHKRLMQAAEQARSRAVVLLAKSERSPYSTYISLGRARNCDVVLRDASVSKLHALFFVRAAKWHVVDRGSANGTAVNGATLMRDEPTRIGPGDRMTFGLLQCLFADGEILFRELGPANEVD
jgi:pSer/pThr/pTyr-binding forkhead associated (FHA) protein